MLLDEEELEESLDLFIVLILDDSLKLVDSEALFDTALADLDHRQIPASELIEAKLGIGDFDLTVNRVEETEKEVFLLLLDISELADLGLEIFVGVVDSSVLKQSLCH